ncbi:hypothetical protein [Glycomyces tarimensis]
MKNDHARARATAWFAAGAIALSPLAACGDDEGRATDSGGDTDVEDITGDDYFSDEEYIGDTVTVSAEVTDVLTATSFELAGEEYADESLLVLTEQEIAVAEGDIVQVIGTVEESFRYDDYVDQYNLDEPEPYERYGDEEFLTAERIETISGEESGDN